MPWSLHDLYSLLESQEDLTASKEEDTILISNDDGIDAFVTVSGEQILVEALLCPLSQVSDRATFNDLILRTHKNMFPLTTIGITGIGTEEFYVAFGALSAESGPDAILIEIGTLFLNIEGMLEFYQEHLG